MGAWCGIENCKQRIELTFLVHNLSRESKLSELDLLFRLRNNIKAFKSVLFSRTTGKFSPIMTSDPCKWYKEPTAKFSVLEHYYHYTLFIFVKL